MGDLPESPRVAPLLKPVQKKKNNIALITLAVERDIVAVWQNVHES